MIKKTINKKYFTNIKTDHIQELSNIFRFGDNIYQNFSF